MNSTPLKKLTARHKKMAVMSASGSSPEDIAQEMNMNTDFVRQRMKDPKIIAFHEKIVERTIDKTIEKNAEKLAEAQEFLGKNLMIHLRNIDTLSKNADNDSVRLRASALFLRAAGLSFKEKLEDEAPEMPHLSIRDKQNKQKDEKTA